MKPKKDKKKRRASGIPTGNAGEYFVMGELLRRGFDAQLADRNTQGYDMLVGSVGKSMRRVQDKTTRQGQWYKSRLDFLHDALNRLTVYVKLGPVGSDTPVRYFIAKNRDVRKHFHRPKSWRTNGTIAMKAVKKYENKWNGLWT